MIFARIHAGEEASHSNEKAYEVAQVQVYHAAEDKQLSAAKIDFDEKKFDSAALEIKSLHDVPFVCAALAHKLMQQPMFQGVGNIPKASKVLPLPSYDEAIIVTLINEMATTKIAKEKRLLIHPLGMQDDGVYNEKGQHIPYGVSLWMTRADRDYCSVKELYNAYTSIISHISQGWMLEAAHKHGKVLFSENPHTWHLLIKEKGYNAEDELIQHLATYWNISHDISCHNLWVTSNGDCEIRNPYCWVRKSAYVAIASRFFFPKLSQE